MAVPGTTFEIPISSTQTNFPELKGTEIKKGHGVNAVLTVDGTKIGQKLFNIFGKESIAKGFLESVDASGQAAYRKFMFQNAATTEGGHSGAEGSGEIVLRMFCGNMCTVETRTQKHNVNAGHSKVPEKAALKAGKSIGVTKNGTKMKMKTSSTYQSVRDSQEVGCCRIFLRERFWLESRLSGFTFSSKYIFLCEAELE